MANRISIAYYITAHGYGHAVRSCDVIAALDRANPEVSIAVTTSLPLQAFYGRVDPFRLTFRYGCFDVGLVQHDAVAADHAATLAALEDLSARRDELLRKEIAYLRRHEIRLVVADIPGLPLVAARECGIPAIATGNFGWDWIYADLAMSEPRWEAHAARFATDYAAADLLLRYPFAPAMPAFRACEDVGLTARPGRPCREAIAAFCGADPAKPWILPAFTSVRWGAAASAALAALDRYELIVVEPLAPPTPTARVVGSDTFDFRDVLASCDIVISKPGYGIVSDCIVNAKPLIHVERGQFAETPILLDGIARHLRQAPLGAADFYAGRWEAALTRLAQAAVPAATLTADGAARVATRIIACAQAGRAAPYADGATAPVVTPGTSQTDA